MSSTLSFIETWRILLKKSDGLSWITPVTRKSGKFKIGHERKLQEAGSEMKEQEC